MKAGGIAPIVLAALIGGGAQLASTAINAATKQDPAQPAQGAMPTAPQVTPVASERAPLPGLQSRPMENDDGDERQRLATSILTSGG
ncbi:MAG TPA: hypothetical protein PLL10_00140 [Elusimicrobiales bacterium]|nr:hypothetical protein [Elusimicrobiales bacterium]